jgi:hypothetical protein
VRDAEELSKNIPTAIPNAITKLALARVIIDFIFGSPYQQNFWRARLVC